MSILFPKIGRLDKLFKIEGAQDTIIGEYHMT